MKHTMLARHVAIAFLSVFWLSRGEGLGQTILNASTRPRFQNTILSAPRGEIDIYVAPSGRDPSGRGTLTSPYQTIGRALQDVPESVSQHYVIKLAAGVYYEQVNIAGRYFASDATSSFTQVSIELRGDPAHPDSYIISGATSGAPTTPAKDYCVTNSSANLFLNGLSLQYAKVAGLWQTKGSTLTNNISIRHVTTAPPGGWQGYGAYAIYVYNAVVETWGSLVVSDVYNGLCADHRAIITGTGDPLNAGLPDAGDYYWSITGVTGGVGLAAYVMSEIDAIYHGAKAATLTGTGVDGSIGILAQFFGNVWWDGGIIGSFPTLIDAAQGGVVTGYNFVLQDAAIGILAENGGRFETWPGQTPSFSNVTTPRSTSQGGIISDPSGNYFDGNWTANGAVNIEAGGTNQNVTLTPTGSGSIVLNGVVGIGGPSTGAKLQISSPGGSQTYFDIADADAKKDTLINLNAVGNSDGTFFLRAKSNGSDRWWVKSDGSTFSTSLSTAINEVLFSPSPVFDASLGNVQKIRLTGDVVSSILLNPSPGQTLVFVVCQDSAGGHKFTWPPNMKGGVNIGAITPFGEMIGAAPNKCTAEQFIFTGTNAYSVGPGSTNM
jgi:hypothetical protein